MPVSVTELTLLRRSMLMLFDAPWCLALPLKSLCQILGLCAFLPTTSIDAGRPRLSCLIGGGLPYLVLVCTP